MVLRGRHSNCLSNLLKIQNWAGNTEKQIYWSKVDWRFRQILWSSQKTQTLTNFHCYILGLAITFVSDETDAKVLNEVQDRFEVDITELPEEIDLSSYIEGR